MGERQAFQNIKVVDFGAGGAMPLATKYLADHGATVVKVESITRIDFMRSHPPFVANIRGVNRAGGFFIFNSSKYSISLNLRHPKGLEIAKRLVAWCDIMGENWTLGVKEKLGLGYDELVHVNPRLIMVSTSAAGGSGPEAGMVGIGYSVTAACGYTYITGMPDSPPQAVNTVLPDYTGGYYTLLAMLAALDYRQRTDKGQHLDISQKEGGISLLPAVMLDYSVNKRVANRIGNYCEYACPHGAFRCKGDDAWCTIAVFTDAEWKAFCQIIGNPAWTTHDKFASFANRKSNEAELEQLIGAWTINYSPVEVMSQLQQAGVPSGIVANSKDLFDDPQLKYRQYWQFLNHPEAGLAAHNNTPFKLSKTPSEIRRAPCLGEHTHFVCSELLHMGDEEFIQLENEGVFQ